MIVVTTPTGRIGGRVVETLLAGPEQIRVVCRDPSRLAPQVRTRVDVVTGSHDDPEVIDRAFTGADSVFWLVPPSRTAGNPVDYYVDFTRPACAAITAHGVSRVVAVSSLGREYPGNAGLLTAAFAMDGLIESTGVRYRALRPPYFLENLLGQADTIRDRGVLALAYTADRPLRTVATADIAAAAAALLRDPSWHGQDGVPLVGPDELTPNAMAQIMSDVVGRPIRFHQLTIADIRAQFAARGALPAAAQGMTNMLIAQNNGVYDGPLAERTATDFRRWCTTVLLPATAHP